MQASDNEAAVIDRPSGGAPVGRGDPERDSNDAIVGREDPEDAQKTVEVGADNSRTRFKSGNQLWRRRGKSQEVAAARRLLREAFHKALTPDKMAKAVRRMLTIINSDDKKAAVAAFKVLTEAGGLKGDADGSKSGSTFTFILPGPGAIPEGPVDVRERGICQTLALPELIDPPRPVTPIED